MNEQIESPGDRITLISGPGIDGDNRRRQTCMRFKGEEEREKKKKQLRSPSLANIGIQSVGFA